MHVNDFVEDSLALFYLVEKLSQHVVLQAIVSIHLFHQQFTVSVGGDPPAGVSRADIKSFDQGLVFSPIVGRVSNTLGFQQELVTVTIPPSTKSLM
jgi:hypothetical protein